MRGPPAMRREGLANPGSGVLVGCLEEKPWVNPRQGIL